MKKRILALVLSLALLMSMVPGTLATSAASDSTSTQVEIGNSDPVVCDNCGAEGHTIETCEACTECKQTEAHLETCSLNLLTAGDAEGTVSGNDLEDPQPCQTCGTEGCTSTHENWCAECEKDDCGLDHSSKPETCEYCEVELTEGAVHEATCLTNCTCTPVDGVHNSGCVFALVVESAGPQVGDTIWIEKNSLVYKAVDGADTHKLLGNYEVKIKSIVNSEWYEFEFTNLGLGEVWLYLSGYKYVKIENTSVEEPEDVTNADKEVSVDGKTIKLSGEIPASVTVDASSVAYSDAPLGEQEFDYEVLAAYDITLLNDDGTEWQPEEGKTVQVSLDVSNLETDECGMLSVAHLHNDELKLLGEYEVVDGMLTFETDGFSTFYIYVEILRGGYSYLIAPGKEETISLKALMEDMGYTSFYCVTSVISSKTEVIDRLAWGTEYTNKNGNTAYADATLNINAAKEFEGYVELTVKYHSTKARYESSNASSNLYTRVIRLYSSSVSVNTIDDVLQDDGVNVHVFNYGAAINDSSTIVSQNSNSGFLPFGQGGYEDFPNIDQRYQYYKSGATETSNAYENMSEIDGEATGNSYAPVMSKTLINGYPYISSNVTKDSAPTITSGSLQYLFDKDETFVQGSGGLTNYVNLTSIWDGATKISEEKASSTTGYTTNGKNSYQSMHFSTAGDSGLFQDVGGYYYYNSAYNAAYFDVTQNKFVIYDQTVVPKYLLDDSNDGETIKGTGDKVTGNFLPFNELTNYTIGDVNAAIAYGNHINELNEAKTNPNGNNEGKTYRTDWPSEGASTYLLHRDDESRTDLWFGMSADYDFYMPEDGKMYNNKTQEYDDMVYQFTGDDDVWVYIDDVLILDIGGCHRPCVGTINFATGEVVYERSRSEATPTGESSIVTHNTTLYECYVNAYNELSNTERQSDTGVKIKDIIDNGFVTLENGKKIFKDYTIHSFDFFYLERGGNISSMEMKFNLEPIQDVSLIVQKKVENLNDVFADQAYTFKISAKDASDHDLSGITYTLNGQEKTVSSDGTFMLKDGQAAIFNTFALGYDIVVQETSTGAYSTTNTITPNIGTGGNGTSTGTLTFTEENKAYTVLFKNSWNSADLKIEKEVIGDVGEQEFKFVLKYDDTHKFEFTLKHGENTTIEDLPVGYIFTLAEIDPSSDAFRYQAPKYNGTEYAFDSENPFSITIAENNNSVKVANRCVTDLKIIKNLTSAAMEDQTFLFHVEELNMDVALVIKKGETTATAVIKDVLVGTYKVTEDQNWAWRYEIDTNAQVGNSQEAQVTLTADADKNKVTFTNKRTDPYWLSGDCYTENWWGENSIRRKDEYTDPAKSKTE